MKFAKIENETIEFAPNSLYIDNKIIKEPTVDDYLNAGYLPYYEEEMPESSNYIVYTSQFVEKNEAVWKIWNTVYLPYEEIINIEIRKKYSPSAEFAILRQKDEKPEEYKAYYDYCEECKALAKSLREIEVIE